MNFTDDINFLNNALNMLNQIGSNVKELKEVYVFGVDSIEHASFQTAHRLRALECALALSEVAAFDVLRELSALREATCSVEADEAGDAGGNIVEFKSGGATAAE